MVNYGYLISSDDSEDSIYIHSGISSTLTGSFSSPEMQPQGLTIDSDGNLISCDTFTVHIYTHSGISSTLTGSFSSPGDGFPWGLTIDSDGNLISSEIVTVHIYTHSGISSTLTGSFASPGTTPRGLTIDSDGNLISCDNSTDHIYTHSGISDTLTGSFSSPSSIPMGLTIDSDGNLISSDYSEEYIYIHSGISDTLTGSFASPGTTPRGLVYNSPPPAQVYSKTFDEEITLTDNFSTEYTHIPRTLSEIQEDEFTLTDDFTSTLIEGVGTVSKTFSEEFTSTDDFSITYTHNYVTIQSELDDEITITDDFTTTLIQPSETFSKTLSDELNFTDDFSVTYTHPSQTYSETLNEEINLTDSFTSTRTISGQFSPTATYDIKTKIEIDGTEYFDYRNLRVSKTMSEHSASSNFSVTLDSPFGRHKSSFNVGDEIVIYADDTGTPTTKLLTGIIEKISFRGSGTTQEVTLTGRDYSARLMDATIEPSVYTDSEVSTIVSNIMQNFVDDVTRNNINVTSTTLQRINFRHTSVYNALDELAELSNFIWYIDTDKDLHFEETESVSSGYYLDNNVILSTNYEQTREGMVNDVWVYGDKYLAGFQETIDVGSPTGSTITLINKPHNTYLEYLGSPYKGGVYQLTTEAVSGADYLVNYHDRGIIFVSGEDIGYDSIPESGGSVLVRYDREIPIIRHKRDSSSISAYGKKTKVIQDDSIKDPTSANDLANKEIEKSSPFKGLELELRGWLNLTPGNTVQVVLDDFNISETVGIISVDYTFDANRIQSNRVIKLKVDKKILDLTDEIKNLSKKVQKLESRNLVEEQTITRYEEFTGSALVSGRYWEVNSRTIGSSFILGHPFNGILGSPAPSQDGGSQVVLGDSRSAFTTQISGGTA